MSEDFKVKFERSGGFTGIRHVLTIDSKSLSVEESHNLLSMIKLSGFFELQGTPAISTGMSDGFIYLISIVTAEINKTVELNETSVPDRLRPLINYFSGKARLQNSNI
jgi:hypothetical protein